jgi:Tol biopolymer transport system component
VKILVKVFFILFISNLVFAQEDSGHKISPDGLQVIFVRYQKLHSYGDNDPSLFLDPFSELWSVNADGSNERCIIKNNYSPSVDIGSYLGNFDSLHFSPDGKRIYFLSQNCATDAILYSANADGSNIKRISNAHQLDVIGGNPESKYYGYLVAGIRKSQGVKPIKWTVVLLDAEGKEITEIEDVEAFWKEHKKL